MHEPKPHAGATDAKATVGLTVWYSLTLLTVCNVFASMDRGIITVLIDQIKTDLSLSDTAMGLLTGLVFQAIYVVAGFPIARLADKVSPKLVISGSLGLWSLMTCVCGLASNGLQLVLARAGVGLGEAGGNGPSQGLIASLFDKTNRARALGIFNLGITIGAPAGWLVGALVGHEYGWRVAFVVAGAPGLVLALIMALTMKDVVRKPSLSARPDTKFWPAVRYLLSQRSFVLTLIGALFFTFAYAANAWLPAFLGRVHGLPLAEVGLSLAACHGVFGTIGTLGGGWLASKFGGDDRVRLWWAAGACLAGILPYAFFLFAEGDIAGSGYPLALVGLCGVYLTLASVFGPMMASYQTAAPEGSRSLAAALYWVVGGAGLSLAPFVLGVINDMLRPSLGEGGVRYSLICAIAVLPFAALFFMLASRYIKEDAARAEAQSG